MTRAFLFDFHRTLVRSDPWIDLEIRGLPGQAMAQLAAQGVIPACGPEQLARAEAVFAEARRQAETTGRETSHIDDLLSIAQALDYGSLVTRAIAEETIAGLHRHCVETAELLDGAAETLRGLREMGYRLSIVSNATYSPFLRWTLDRFGLLGEFEHVVVSADVGARKPWPEIFNIALDRLGLAPAEAAYVGDDLIKDIVAPKRAGMRAIWYRPEGNLSISDPAAQPDAVVTALDQILAWGERWRSEANR